MLIAFRTGNILKLFENLHTSGELSDVTFIVEGVKIPAHKVILSASSSYFRALFFDGFAESSQKEIKLHVNLEPLKLVLKYIYTGHISLVGFDGDQIMELCNLANQYDIESLKRAISKHLAHNISLDNCHSMLISAQTYAMDDLKAACFKFFDRNCIEMIQQEAFNKIPQDLLMDLLKRDTFYAPEIEIFCAVNGWYEENPNADVKVSSKHLNV